MNVALSLESSVMRVCTMLLTWNFEFVCVLVVSSMKLLNSRTVSALVLLVFHKVFASSFHTNFVVVVNMVLNVHRNHKVY